MTDNGDSRARSLAALEYHDIVEPEGADASGFPGRSAATYKLSRPDFARHLQQLQQLSVECPARDGSGSPGIGAVVLTFDDGGADALRVTAPLLEHFGMRGVFFMTTGMIGRPGFLRAADLRELDARGHAVGSHSVSHPIRFSALDPARMARELSHSRDSLEQVLGGEVRIGSVPGGYFSRKVAVVAAAQGYRWLFTSEPTSRLYVVNGCTVAGRFTLRQGDPASRAWSLATGEGSARRSAALAWQAKKVIKAIAAPAYLSLRRMVYRDDKVSAMPLKGRE